MDWWNFSGSTYYNTFLSLSFIFLDLLVHVIYLSLTKRATVKSKFICSHYIHSFLQQIRLSKYLCTFIDCIFFLIASMMNQNLAWNFYLSRILLKHVKLTPVLSALIDCDLGPSQQKLAWDSKSLLSAPGIVICDRSAWVSLRRPETSDDTGDHPRPQGQLRGGSVLSQSSVSAPAGPHFAQCPSFSYCPVSILRKECCLLCSSDYTYLVDVLCNANDISFIYDWENVAVWWIMD